MYKFLTFDISSSRKTSVVSPHHQTYTKTTNPSDMRGKERLGEAKRRQGEGKAKARRRQGEGKAKARQYCDFSTQQPCFVFTSEQNLHRREA